MFDEHSFSRSEVGNVATPVLSAELSDRYMLEAKIILGDKLLSAIASLLESIPSIVHESWTESQVPIVISNSSFENYFSESFLESTSFCVTDTCPTLDYSLLGVNLKGLPKESKIAGISFGDYYFVSTECSSKLGIHFHELVHGVQAKILGYETFFTSYVLELVRHGYRKNFFEQMAYDMQWRYLLHSEKFDVNREVFKKLENYSVCE